MKNILLLVHDDLGQEARFQAALDVGRAVGGHLTCLDVTILPTIVAPGYTGDAGFSILLADEHTRESANRARLEARMAKEDVPWDWVDATGEPTSCLKAEAALADLIVINCQLDDFSLPDMRAVAGGLIVASRCPVLAVPQGHERLDPDSAMIAWDGSSAAAAALRAAVPLLRCATNVVLVEIDDGSVALPAEAAASYLSRHGVHATIRRLPSGHRNAAEIITTEASSGNFGYVVMGGFGHSRFVEALFGGVTRALLTNSPVPVFLAH